MQLSRASARLARVESSPFASRWVWALAALPALGLGELGLHVYQVSRALTEADWNRAASDLKAHVGERDGIAVWPSWAEPSARRALGPLATFERFAVADYTRYAQVWELSVDGVSELPASWGHGRPVGDAPSRILVRPRANPNPEPVVSDLLESAARGGEEMLTVLRGKSGAERPCVWREGAPRVEADREAWGVSRGAHFAQCDDGSKLSVQVVPDHHWRPRRCLLAPTAPVGQRTRLVFHKVQFARIVRMHAALHGYEEDAANRGADVRVSVSVRAEGENGEVSEALLGGDVHHDGESWKSFDVDTSAVAAGERGDLIVDVQSERANRLFCLEGSTR